MNTAHRVFSGQIISTVGAAATFVTSQAVRMSGNAATASVAVINVAASPTNAFQLQGSFDGLVWFDIGSAVNQNVFGVVTQSATSIAYAFLRLKASISGSSVTTLFDATIAMSAQ